MVTAALPPSGRHVLPLLAALIGAFWVLGTVTTAITPTLLRDHPLALVALEARNRNLLLAAGKVDVIPFVVFATIRRVISDPLYFALGYLYGDRAVDWVAKRSGARGARFLRWFERIFPRIAKPLVFLFPGLLVCLFAGVTRMRVAVFLAINVAGTITAVIVLRLFADQLHDVLEPLIEWNDRNATKLTVATATLVVLYLVFQRIHGGTELDSMRDLRRELDD
jgi:membrane protein DedA with SNARE-associated domain